MEAVILMKKVYSLFGSLSPEAFAMLTASLRLCCAMLLASLAILLRIGSVTPDTYSLYRLAAELQNSSAAVLILGNAAALLLQQFRRP